MKTLSLWQPWASLLACGRKRYETRGWATNYRGPLLIHAGKTIATDVPHVLAQIIEDEFGGHWARDLPRGALIGSCELISCVPTERIRVDADERAQGNFTPGRFAWEIQNGKVFEQPISYRGMQGLFDVSLDANKGAEVGDELTMCADVIRARFGLEE